MSKPYDRSHGPATFLSVGCQRWDTACHVDAIMSGLRCVIILSGGRYFAQSVSAKRETPVYVPELNSDRVLARSKSWMISLA